eukprot:52649-Pelagomonas_calceolata.AAC.1
MTEPGACTSAIYQVDVIEFISTEHTPRYVGERVCRGQLWTNDAAPVPPSSCLSKCTTLHHNR